MSAGGKADANTTYRQFAHLSVGGSAVRIRLSNRYGGEPLTFDAAAVGIRSKDAALVAGSTRPLTMHGRKVIVVPVGGYVYTDPVRLDVRAQQDVAVSLFSSTVPPVSQHGASAVTEFFGLPGSGDHTRDEVAAGFVRKQSKVLWMDAVDVLTTEARGTIVAIGDSITDCCNVAADSNARWLDDLGRRLDSLSTNDSHRRAVVNAGNTGGLLGGDDINGDRVGGSGLHRMERDVFSQTGVTDVAVFLGTNDIAAGRTSSQIIEDLKEATRRIHLHGMRAIGVTILPREGGAGYVPPSMEPVRKAVNDWLRASSSFDAVWDFATTLSQPMQRDVMNVTYSGDGTHPNETGHKAMADAVNLAIFR